MQELADTELLRQYTEQNSEAAFAELVTRHVPLVYSAALRKTANPSAAEEVTQAVFVILARKARALPRQTVLSGWLYQAARLTAANFLRTEIRRIRREQEAVMQSISNQTDADVWPHIRPLLEDAMGRLGERERNAVVLRFFEGKSFQEIGVAVGASENAAKKRVAHALEKLRKFFRHRGVDSTTADIAETISIHSIQTAPLALAKSVTAVAVAKGVAAPISTLTLVKGALKIMAWTKAKTTVVASAVLILAAGTATVAIKTVNASRTRAALAAMQGSWEGTLDISQAHLRLVLRIFKTNDAYRAVIDSVDQGATDIPIAKLSARKDSFHAELPALNADYQAALNADGTEMSGTWKQLKRSLTLTFKKTTEAARVAQPLAAADFAPQAGSDLQGAWEGALRVGNTQLRLALKIVEPTPGTFHAQMDSVDQGARNLPVTSLTYNKPAVRFEMTAINGVYEGTLNNRDDEMTGTWTQAGRKFPLTFRRVQTSAPTTVEAQKDYGQGANYQVQGHWNGVLEINQLTLHMMFHIALMPDGSYSATLDSPDQGVTGIPATTVEFTYPNIRIEWNGINGIFAGKLENGQLSGTWRQGKAVLPLKLERGKTE